jgi:eukaryotic-like serine/threonine-protein kinase
MYCTLLRLGTGGMGSVDLAIRREGSFERLFAQKRLKPELVDDAEVRSMLLEEARLAGLVRHPNVVGVVDLGEDEQGPFLVMDYVEGVSAAELLAATPPGGLPMEVCLGIARDAAEGLHAAHELAAPDGTPLELVHRDVSPENVLLGFDGVARVTDFGIAKALGRTTRTSTGVLKGKLGYMAPEQLRFEEPDRRADLFALGVVLFELLSGKRLYRSEGDLDGPRRILTEPPPDLADHRDDVEPELVELVLELLAKSRESRPETARAVARRLDAILVTVRAAGGAVDTADYLSEHFGAARARRRAAVADAIDRARARSAESTTTTGIEVVSKPLARPSRAALAALLAGVSIAAAVFWPRHAAGPRASSAAIAASMSPDDVAPKRSAPTLSAATALPSAAVAPSEPGMAAPPATSAGPGAVARPRKPAVHKPADGSSHRTPLWEHY